jgi:PAS domain-containing protein
LLVTWRGLNPASAILNVLIAALVFGALLLLHRESNKHRVTRMRLRLSQANEKTSRVLSDDEMAEVFAGVRAPAGGQALEQAIHASSQPIVVFDRQGRPTIWNAAAAQSLDLARLGAAGDVPPPAAPVERPLANPSEAPV